MSILSIKKTENEEEKVWVGRQIGRSTFLRKLFHISSNYLILRSWYIRKEIRKWAKKDHTDVNILDAGSGFGQCAYYLSSLNSKWNIFSLDINRDKVCQCNSFFNNIGRQNVVFRTGDIKDHISEKSYDLALSIDVLNYIEDDDQVIRNIYSSLKPNGTFLLSVPTCHSEFDKFPIQTEKQILNPVRRGYKKKELIKKVKDAGFEIEYIAFTYGKAGKWAYNIAIRWPLKALQLAKFSVIILPFYWIFSLPVAIVLNIYDMFAKNRNGEGLIIRALKKQ
jgi:2-polyprenyl-3-methyl-5-hydroxy-6-metoxy-1,4-benzoquinol methylase